MTVRVSRRGAIQIITLDRPEKRNAFDGRLTVALDIALNDFEDDATSSVVIITGGRDVFSAGTDLVSSAGPPTRRGGPYGIADRAFQKPAIAAVEGLAAGGGMEICLAATLVVASTEATFSLPEVGLGLVAECGGLFRAPRSLPLNVARELLLTGEQLSATRGYELGFVNRLATPESVLDEALVLAERVSAMAPIAVRETLAALESAHSANDAAAWAATNQASARVRASADSAEGFAAFVQRRAPAWSGT